MTRGQMIQLLLLVYVGLPGREAGEWRTTDPKQRAKAARVEAAEPVPDDQPSLLDFSGGAA